MIETRDSRAQLAAAAEATVVRLAVLGDDAAFAELVRRRQSAIRSLLRRLCGESALAEDLAQQTFMAAWSQLTKLRQPAAFGGWLRQIAVNAWLAHLRREGAVWVSLPEELEIADAVEPAVALDMEQLLARLKPAERVCVVLAHVEGLSHTEIAAATAWPLGTVKSHVLRGSARLRQWLGDSGESS